MNETEKHKAAWAAYLNWSDKSGWTQTRLADEVITNRAHLNQVLTGARSGGQTWRRIVKVLPMDGVLLLQHCSAWNKFAAAALAKRRESERQQALLESMAAKCREPEAVNA